MMEQPDRNCGAATVLFWTTIVKNIQNGSGGSDPDSLVNVNGKLFFSADNGTHGKELWSSDGTSGEPHSSKTSFSGVVVLIPVR